MSGDSGLDDTAADVQGYRHAVLAYYPDGLRLFRIDEYVGVVLLPCVAGGGVTLQECAPVCIRV